MVPSWTETLLHAGVQVVGRTRYCIHPADLVAQIPIVGGTKDIKWDLVQDLNADLLLLDQEENPLEMAESSPIPYLATHVSSLPDLQRELERLGDHFRNPVLVNLAVECLDFISEAKFKKWGPQIPGSIESIGLPLQKKQKIIYLIWKKPWMAASKDTYIGSVLTSLGAEMVEFSEDENKYPVVDIDAHQDSFFLFSSEPFPFHKKQGELLKMGLSGAIVDGESYSWFGVRSLRFLASLSERVL